MTEPRFVFPRFATINADDPHLSYYLELATLRGEAFAVDYSNRQKPWPEPKP